MTSGKLKECVLEIIRSHNLSPVELLSQSSLRKLVKREARQRCPDIFNLQDFIHVLNELGGRGKTRETRKDVPLMTVLGALYAVYHDERLLSHPQLAVPVCCSSLDRVVSALRFAGSLGFDVSRVVPVLCTYSSCCDRERCLSSLSRMLGGRDDG